LTTITLTTVYFQQIAVIELAEPVGWTDIKVLDKNEK
jgi:hypothetical protein